MNYRNGVKIACFLLKPITRIVMNIEVIMKMLLKIFAALSTLLILGCETSYVANNKKFCLDDKGLYFECGEVKISSTQLGNASVNDSGSTNAFVPGENFILLKDYAEQLAYQLYTNMNIEQIYYPIVVSSFVNYDASLNSSTVLGNQLSEVLIHELQKLGLPVVEHKLTGKIKVTPEGDFVLSRDVSELQRGLKVGAIITGTLITSKKGIVVNSRVVQIDSSQVLSSASQVIPFWVMEQLG